MAGSVEAVWEDLRVQICCGMFWPKFVDLSALHWNDGLLGSLGEWTASITGTGLTHLHWKNLKNM